VFFGYILAVIDICQIDIGQLGCQRIAAGGAFGLPGQVHFALEHIELAGAVYFPGLGQEGADPEVYIAVRAVIFIGYIAGAGNLSFPGRIGGYDAVLVLIVIAEFQAGNRRPSKKRRLGQKVDLFSAKDRFLILGQGKFVGWFLVNLHGEPSGEEADVAGFDLHIIISGF
jgi:hypothetical protein